MSPTPNRGSLVCLSALLAALLGGCGQTQCKGATCGNDAGVVDAGRDACGGTCSAFLPVCDAARRVCVTCTDTAGCSGSTPVCDTTAFSGRGACLACLGTRGCSALNPVCLAEASGRRCVECASSSDCHVTGDVCTLNRCGPDYTSRDAGGDGGLGDGGAADAGGEADAGASADAGLDAGSDAGSVTPDAGGVCIMHTPMGSCVPECPRGFHCAGSACVLNGGNGPVQVTLRWNTGEDVDLHVIEPTATGPCDVYYGNRTGTTCGARGALDLDSNAGCSQDNVDIENIIYDPDGGAPSGQYQVRVDHYSNCDPATVFVPYEVDVRVGTTHTGYCGSFVAGGPGWSAHGSANSGTQVLTFTVP